MMQDPRAIKAIEDLTKIVSGLLDRIFALEEEVRAIRRQLPDIR